MESDGWDEDWHGYRVEDGGGYQDEDSWGGHDQDKDGGGYQHNNDNMAMNNLEDHQPNYNDQRRPSVPARPQNQNPLSELDLAELEQSACINFLHRDMQFIRCLRDATLDKPGRLSDDALKCLYNPPQTTPEIEDPVVELALSMFLALKHSSQENAVQKCFPGSTVPSLYQIKKMLVDITGVKPIISNMCINSCVTYVGLYADLDQCPTCQEHWYDQVQLTHSSGRTKAPRAVFNTIPIGPQLQALYWNSQTATKLHYYNEQTWQIWEEIDWNQSVPDGYDNILTGEAYLEAHHT